MRTDDAMRTVLLIDDEEDARRLVKLLLEHEGYRVLTSPSGSEGMILAKVEHPDVILLDIIMPKMNGHDVLHRLKDDPDTCTIPVIMLTAKGAERDIAASFQLKAAFHVEKPFQVRDLLEKIQVAFILSAPHASPGSEIFPPA